MTIIPVPNRQRSRYPHGLVAARRGPFNSADSVALLAETSGSLSLLYRRKPAPTGRVDYPLLQLRPTETLVSRAAMAIGITDGARILLRTHGDGRAVTAEEDAAAGREGIVGDMLTHEHAQPTARGPDCSYVHTARTRARGAGVQTTERQRRNCFSSADERMRARGLTSATSEIAFSLQPDMAVIGLPDAGRPVGAAGYVRPQYARAVDPRWLSGGMPPLYITEGVNDQLQYTWIDGTTHVLPLSPTALQPTPDFAHTEPAAPYDIYMLASDLERGQRANGHWFRAADGSRDVFLLAVRWNAETGRAALRMGALTADELFATSPTYLPGDDTGRALGTLAVSGPGTQTLFFLTVTGATSDPASGTTPSVLEALGFASSQLPVAPTLTDGGVQDICGINLSRVRAFVRLMKRAYSNPAFRCQGSVPSSANTNRLRVVEAQRAAASYIPSFGLATARALAFQHAISYPVTLKTYYSSPAASCGRAACSLRR